MCLTSIFQDIYDWTHNVAVACWQQRGEVKNTDDFHCSSSGLLSTSMCHRAAGKNIEQPPKFVPPSKPVIVDKTQTVASMRKYDSITSLILTDAIFKRPQHTVCLLCRCLSLKRFLSPEFIPPRQRTDPLKFFVERKDMIRRRKVLNIPEFYAGRSPGQAFCILIGYLKVFFVSMWLCLLGFVTLVRETNVFPSLSSP